jgi:hypothetical protein
MVNTEICRTRDFPADFLIFLLIVCGVHYSMFVKLKRRPLTLLII